MKLWIYSDLNGRTWYVSKDDDDILHVIIRHGDRIVCIEQHMDWEIIDKAKENGYIKFIEEQTI